MKIIRHGIFETNSSSAHSLVIHKEDEDLSKLGRYDLISKIFGNSELEYELDYDWDENDKKVFTNEVVHEFTFNRGLPRVYDDFINKVAFIICYFRYRDEIEGIIDHLIDFVSNYIKEVKEKYPILDGNYLDDEEGLWEKYKVDFKNEKIRDEIISGEFEYNSTIMEQLISDDELLEKFLFDSSSYISISGDEYQDVYLRLVGSYYEYCDYYNRDYNKVHKAFEERVAKVYPKDKFIVERKI